MWNVGRQLYEINYGWGPRLMSALRKRWILLTHRHANIVFGRDTYRVTRTCATPARFTLRSRKAGWRSNDFISLANNSALPSLHQ